LNGLNLNGCVVQFAMFEHSRPYFSTSNPKTASEVFR